MSHSGNTDYQSLVDLQSIREIHDIHWTRKKNKIKYQLLNYIHAQLRDTQTVFRKLAAQARQGRNYISVTDRLFVCHPARFLSDDHQWQVMNEVADELEQFLAPLYGNELRVDVCMCPSTFSNTLGFIFYEIRLFYPSGTDETTHILN